jgi:rhamnosyltransferase
MASRPYISILVVARNEAKNVDLCLGGVKRQRINYDLEIILIDSSSTDGTPELASQYGAQVHVIPKQEFHHSRTRNLAASLSRGELLVFLGGDAWPAHERWLEELIKPLQENRDIAAAYGRQLPKPGCDPINRFRLRWNYGSERIDKHLGLETQLAHRLYFFSTVNCVIRRSIWERFRFPEDIHIFEDQAFIRQVIGAGYTATYVPTAEVTHSHNLNSWDILNRYRDMGYVQSQYRFVDRQQKNYQKEGTRYLRTGFLEILNDGGWAWAARFVLHTMSGYIGLVWGQTLQKLNASG